jgi:hypothetical protein
MSSTNNEIMEYINNNENIIKITDNDNLSNLKIFSYEKRDNVFTDNLPVNLECRGIIINDGTIIMKNLPYTYEYSDRDSDIKEKLEYVLKDCRFFESHEGCLIRVFYFNSKWFMSTNRKLDASNSRWSSDKSFGKYFVEGLKKISTYKNDTNDSIILEKFYSTLNIEKKYVFLLKNSEENRIVCKNPVGEPSIYHIGTYFNDVFLLDDECHNIPHPKEYNFLDVETLIDHVKNTDVFNNQGIICFGSNGFQYKILNSIYLDYFKVRNNEPNIILRYLEIRTDKNLYNKFIHLYPNIYYKFENIEKLIYEICLKILNCYVNRFIKKTFSVVNQKEYKIVCKCHNWHKTDMNNNKINYNKVAEYFNTESAKDIYDMIKNHSSNTN